MSALADYDAAIRQIDCAIAAIRLNLQKREGIDPRSPADWQAAWDKHPVWNLVERSMLKRRAALVTKRHRRNHRQRLIALRDYARARRAGQRMERQE